LFTAIEIGVYLIGFSHVWFGWSSMSSCLLESTQNPSQQRNMPSGHVPANVLEHPEFYGGINCCIEVPQDTVHLLREALSEEVGPCEQHLAWVTEEFSTMMDTVHEVMGWLKITLENSLNIFSQMSNLIEDLGMDIA
jgi:hypothetical protein